MPSLRHGILLLLASLMMLCTLNAAPSVTLSSLSQCQPGNIANNIGLGFKIPAISIGISIIALFISFDVIVIGYILSKLFPSAGISGWLGNEYWEFAKSVMLVAAIFSVVTLIGNIAVITAGNNIPASGRAPLRAGTPTYIANADLLTYGSEVYLCNTEGEIEYGVKHMVSLFLSFGFFKGGLNGGGGFGSDLTSIGSLFSTKNNNGIAGNGAYSGLSFVFPGIPIPPVPLPAAFDFIPVFRTMVSFIIFGNFFLQSDFIYHVQLVSVFNDALVFLETPAMLIFVGQIMLLPLLIRIGLLVLIPMGLIMRAFPFIRGIGGTLIAFGIGISIIWPSLLILLNAPVSVYFSNVLGAANMMPTDLPVNSCSVSTSSLLNKVFTFFANGCSPPGTPSDPLLIVGVTTNLALQAISNPYPAMNFVIQNNLYIMLQTYFLFVLDAIIAFPLTDNIARMLGGTIRLQIGGKLKLV
jgi:hypothetical protein